MSSDSPVVAKGYADLVSDPKLEGDDPDDVARELQDVGGEEEYLVAWLPDWLAEEKDLKPVGRSENVVSGRIDHETEDAYLVKSGRDDAWLPKSVIRVYWLAPGVEISIPQRGLTDYAREGM
jgi:hypothetical protein